MSDAGERPRAVHPWGSLGPFGDLFWDVAIASHFAGFFAGSVPLGWGAIPAAWLCGALAGQDRALDRRAGERAAQRILGNACAALLRSTARTRILRVREHIAPGGEPIAEPLPEPCVVVANHPALVDVLVLLATYPSLGVVARRSRYTTALTGFMQRCCGHIDAGDRSAAAGKRAYEAALRRLRDGGSVLVFPEGTRSKPGGLGHFSKGPFRLAVEAGVPVIPVVVRCDPPSLARGHSMWTLPRATMDYRITRLADVASHGSTPRALMRAVRAIIGDALLR